MPSFDNDERSLNGAMQSQPSCAAPQLVALQHDGLYLDGIGIKTDPGGLIHQPV